MKQFVERYVPTVVIVLAIISFWTPMYTVLDEYEYTGFNVMTGVDIGYGYVLHNNSAFALLLVLPIVGAGLLYVIRRTKVCMGVSVLMSLASIGCLVILTNFQKSTMGQYMSLQVGFWAIFFFFVCWCAATLTVFIKSLKNTELQEAGVSNSEQEEKMVILESKKKFEFPKKKQKTEAKMEPKKQELSPLQIIEEDDRTVSIANDVNKNTMIIEIVGESISKVMRLEKFPCTIGGNKAEDNVYLANCELSSSHMALFFEKGQFQVVDNESKSGTKLNGRNIGKTFNPIKMGDLLEAGTIKIKIKQIN